MSRAAIRSAMVIGHNSSSTGRGRRATITSSSVFSSYVVMEVAAASVFRCVSMIPLGSPVLPEVQAFAARPMPLFRRGRPESAARPASGSCQDTPPGT